VDVFGEAIDAMASDAAIALAPRSGRSIREHVLNDGEDFELLATVGCDEQTLRMRLGDVDVPIGVIGRIVDATCGRNIVTGDGRKTPLVPKGYRHF
jgi:thiamine monophosphate kinase